MTVNKVIYWFNTVKSTNTFVVCYIRWENLWPCEKHFVFMVGKRLLHSCYFNTFVTSKPKQKFTPNWKNWWNLISLKLTTLDLTFDLKVIVSFVRRSRSIQFMFYLLKNLISSKTRLQSDLNDSYIHHHRVHALIGSYIN